ASVRRWVRPTPHHHCRPSSLSGDDATGNPGRGDHKQRPPADYATPLPGASAARRAGAAGGPVFDFQAPTTPDDCRPRNACAVTRTGARSCPASPPAANATPGTPPNCATQRILLKPVRSRKKLLKPTTKPHPPRPSYPHPHPHPHPHIKQGRRFLRLRTRFDDLAGGRSPVVRSGLRWRPAVWVCTTARRICSGAAAWPHRSGRRAPDASRRLPSPLEDPPAPHPT
ncbi:hypothetical protein ABH935_007865, partial [Catenulispora sp. GAS73]